MGLSLEEVSRMLGAECRGQQAVTISGCASLANAGPSTVAFFRPTAAKKALVESQALAVLMTADTADSCDYSGVKLVVADPELAFIQLLQYFHPKPVFAPGERHASAQIDPTADVHPSVHIAAHVVVGARSIISAGSVVMAGAVISNDCHIAQDCVIHPRVVLYPQTVLGQSVTIHAGAVIGADGFGYHRQPEGWLKVPQVAGVKIGSHVDIGALTSINCGALDDTVIADGVKIDDHVMIGHNVNIGQHTVIAGCSGIAGSAVVGSHCVIGGMCAIGDHVTVSDQVMLTGQSMVTGNIDQPGIYSSGTGLFLRSKWRRMVARLRRLDQTLKRLQLLEKKS